MTALKEQSQGEGAEAGRFQGDGTEAAKRKGRPGRSQKGHGLEVARRIDAERKRIQEEAENRLAEQYRLKEAEKDKLIEDLKRQGEEFRRKAEQGSQQLQGEVAELPWKRPSRPPSPWTPSRKCRKAYGGRT